jgi:hypothetical protein
LQPAAILKDIRDEMRVSFFAMSAAALIAGGRAEAADLPTRKSAPVDYLKICTAYGPGFFYIPGSDTCIRIAGRAVFEYVTSIVFNRTADVSSFNATGRVIVDARTGTDWAPWQAFLRLDFSSNSGNASPGTFGSGGAARAATKFGYQLAAGPFPSFAGADTAGSKLQTGVGIVAYVQWGGLTAGRLQSFFDFYMDSDTWFGIADSNVLTQALAYTHTFGSGFSATLSIEDPKERQRYPVAGLAPVALGGINPSVATPPFTVTYPFAVSPFAAPSLSLGGISYAQRESIPEVIGVLRVDRGWGSAQLSGAYHRISTVGATVVSLTPGNAGGFVVNPLLPSVPSGYGAVTGNGFAVQGGVKIKMPMVAPDDTLYVEAAYSKGNLAYADSGFPTTYIGQAYTQGGGTTTATYDAVVGPTGKVTLTPAYSTMVSYEHYWAPTFRQGLFAGAVDVKYSASIRTTAGFAAGAACPTCLGSVAFAKGAVYNPFSAQYNGGVQYNVGTNLIWSPVNNLDIGVEAFYFRNQLHHRQFDLNRGAGLLISEDDNWRFRLRVLRGF